MENRFPFILRTHTASRSTSPSSRWSVLVVDLVLAIFHDGGLRLGIGVFLARARMPSWSASTSSAATPSAISWAVAWTASVHRQHAAGVTASGSASAHGTSASRPVGLGQPLASIIVVDLYVRALALDIINTEATPIIGGFL